MPEEYRQMNDEKYANLKRNAKLLTSPFDIYATVRDLTCLDEKEPLLNNNNNNNNKKSRSLSLLGEISPERNCEDIGISEHYCTCEQNWLAVDLTDLKVKEAARFTVDSINKITKLSRSLCLELSLREIISAEVLNRTNQLLFKIQLVTKPNNGIYESLLYDSNIEKFEFSSNVFSIKSRNEISRIDAYGSQPYCVSNFAQNPAHVLDLRKFCYCKPKGSKYKKRN